MNHNSVSNKIKVLVLVDHAVGISGPHRNVVGSLNALSQRDDIHVKLLCSRIDENEPYAKSGKIDIHLGFDPHNIFRIGINLMKVLKVIRNCDLIYVPTGLKSFLYAYFCKGYRKLAAGPNVTGIPFLMNPANPSPLMTMKMADIWIEMSDIRIYHCMKAGTPRDRIHLIPHAIDTDKFHPRHNNRDIWRKQKLNPFVKKIVYVGRMDKELKGIHQLIDTFQIIRQTIQEVDLILIGKPGKYLTEKHRLTERVYPIGPKYGHELVKYLASSDLFIGASRLESFWFAPLEVMSCGVAVVASNAGSVPIMIHQDGIQGRIVKIIDDQTLQFLPDAAQRLATAAIPLLNDDETRKKIGLAAREYVVSEFSESKLGERLAYVFKSAIEKF